MSDSIAQSEARSRTCKKSGELPCYTHVSSDEVMTLLRKVGDGLAVPKLKYPESTWVDVYAGNVFYLVNGWEVVVFNDCDDWDYIDSVIHPDGRKGEYEDWFGAEDENGDSEYQQPDDRLYFENKGCYEKMKKAFIEAV